VPFKRDIYFFRNTLSRLRIPTVPSLHLSYLQWLIVLSKTTKKESVAALWINNYLNPNKNTPFDFQLFHHSNVLG
jgi:hypothetical protein